jgi:hypothetical protein
MHLFLYWCFISNINSIFMHWIARYILMATHIWNLIPIIYKPITAMYVINLRSIFIPDKIYQNLSTYFWWYIKLMLCTIFRDASREPVIVDPYVEHIYITLLWRFFYPARPGLAPFTFRWAVHLLSIEISTGYLSMIVNYH